MQLRAVVTLLLALFLTPASPSKAEEGTVVRAKRRPTSREDVRVANDPALKGSSPQEAVESVGGLGLVRDGGPLSPSRLTARGLSGARTLTTLDGLPLSDPALGTLDPSTLPWLAIASLGHASNAGLAGGLALRLRRAYAPFFLGQLGGGSPGTVQFDSVAGVPVLETGDVVAATSVGTTAGDFSFSPAFSDGTRAAIQSRANNDQHRANVLVRTLLPLNETVQLSSIAFGSFHQGGLPGFATAPTDALRGRRLLLATDLSARFGDTAASAPSLTTSLQLRAGSRSTWSGASATSARHPFQQLRSVATKAAVSVASPLPVLDGSARGTLAAGRAAIVGGPPDANRNARLVASANGVLETSLLHDWLRTHLATELAYYSDIGMQWSGDLSADVGPPRGFRMGARVVRSVRAPTLDELYAPKGLVLGNADLHPEVNNEAEVFLLFLPSALLTIRTSIFASRLDDTILYLNKNAFEIEPTNTGPAWRAGGEAQLRVVPSPLFSTDLNMRLLESRVGATGASLPTIPTFAARSVTRFGGSGRPNAQFAVRYRGASASTLFGTLVVPAYTLIDFTFHIPIDARMSANASVTNLMNVTTARDANLLPLPGRLFFFSFEVRS